VEASFIGGRSGVPVKSTDLSEVTNILLLLAGNKIADTTKPCKALITISCFLSRRNIVMHYSIKRCWILVCFLSVRQNQPIISLANMNTLIITNKLYWCNLLSKKYCYALFYKTLLDFGMFFPCNYLKRVFV
jgi:hypothetical protein